MHPLLDRRDLTAQRERGQIPHIPAYDELCAELAQVAGLLRAGLQQQRASVLQLCVTDRDPAEQVMDNFPVPGARRLIVRRPGAGGLYTLAAGTPTLVLAANENRLGGRIVNSGTGAVTLYLSGDLLTPGSGTPLASGAAQIALAAGAAWDLLLGNLLWCGSVIAQAAAAGSVTAAEV